MVKIPLKVLIVEDSEDDTEMILLELERGGYEPEWDVVRTVEEMNDALERREWDVVISDYSLPRFSGPEALKISKDWNSGTPFILVSGKIGEETAVEVMKSGANDYINKEHLTRLVPAVERELSDAEVRREREQAVEALKLHRDHLEELVQERTKELQDIQEELFRKERLAVLGQLAGGVGHELRNPMGVISNAVYYLKTTLSTDDETTKEYLDIISTMTQNMNKIISDLLELSHVNTGDREEIAITDLVDKALEDQYPPKNLDTDARISSQLPAAFVDPEQISMVLANLLNNAYQAMPDGGNLSIYSQPVEKDLVAISISDTGCGISGGKIEKIFEPLFTTKGSGIGLGLSVSKNLAEINGGRIEVKSDEGKGSTFTLILPTTKVVLK